MAISSFSYRTQLRLNRLDAVTGWCLIAILKCIRWFAATLWICLQKIGLITREIYLQTVHGASKNIRKERTGNRMKDWINLIFFEACRTLDRLDNIVFFRGRIYQTKVCRVRSQGEKRIANFLSDNGISFEYERPLALKKIGKNVSWISRIIIFLINHGMWPVYWPFTSRRLRKRGIIIIRPDFYLTDYKVFLEFWGMIGRDTVYDVMHHLKQEAYRKSLVTVISVYPNQVSRLKDELPRLFKQATGKDFPTLRPKGGDGD